MLLIITEERTWEKEGHTSYSAARTFGIFNLPVLLCPCNEGEGEENSKSGLQGSRIPWVLGKRIPFSPPISSPSYRDNQSHIAGVFEKWVFINTTEGQVILHHSHGRFYLQVYTFRAVPLSQEK